MRSIAARIALAGAIAVTAAFACVGAALANDGNGQLVDISHQLDDMQHKLNELDAKGQKSRQGKLAAAADCEFGAPSQVFLPWGDSASYRMIPQGDLSSTTHWSFKNMQVGADHDPFTPGTGSLVFAKGDSEAITPAMCVTQDDPTLRLFLADRGGNGKANLEVNVIYENLDGNPQHMRVAKLTVNDEWQPSVVIPIGANLLSAASANGWTPVAFDFKVHGLQKGEIFTLDGVYVDPCRSR